MLSSGSCQTGNKKKEAWNILKKILKRKTWIQKWYFNPKKIQCHSNTVYFTSSGAAMKYWVQLLYLFMGLLFCHFLLDSSSWSTAGQLLALQWMFPVVEPASSYTICQFCKGLYLHDLLDIQLRRAVSHFFSWVKTLKAFISDLTCHRQWKRCLWRLSWKPRVRNAGRDMGKGGITAHFTVIGKPCCLSGAMDLGLSSSQSISRLQLWFLTFRAQAQLWVAILQYCPNTVLMDLIRVLLMLKIH